MGGPSSRRRRLQPAGLAGPVRATLHALRARALRLAPDAGQLRRMATGAAAVAVPLALVGVSVAPSGAGHRAPARLAALTAASGPVAAGGWFPGSPLPGRAGAEQSAVALVHHLGGLATDLPAGTGWLEQPVTAAPGTCPPMRLRVSWEPPTGSYRVGSYVAPLGPPPDEHTSEVNGVVLCEGSSLAYLGFEARRSSGRWLIAAVPPSSADHLDRLPTDDTAPSLAPAVPAAAPPPAADAPIAISAWGAGIETLAGYEPQTRCDPVPKPGVVGFRDLLLRSFPGSRDLGIGQPCDAPDGVSEHKEGRAFDWGVRADNPSEHAMADRLLAWLFAADDHGNRYAMIRRLGIMYIIWDGHIWGAYEPNAGWRPYVGVSAHTDHIHFSFTWAGALGQTSFWTGRVSEVGVTGPVDGSTPPPALLAAPAPDQGSPAADAPPSSGSTTTTTTAPPAGRTGGTTSGGTPSSTTTSTTTTTTTPAPPAGSTPPPPVTTPLTTAPPPTLPGLR